ncbi:MAG: phenylalanine--tRNA ligase subunit beta [Bacteroidales bacterium]|nr:phenylalanine--tRNA ligase subunit beta [Bacteroidales bacterium]
MKISYNWLKQYIKTDLSTHNLAEILTNTGLEVEGIESFESVEGGLKGVVVGEVKSASKHPNSDKLILSEVDLGDGNIVSIVCGAPNLKAGQKVPVATIGSTLYKDGDSFKIKKSVIRGETSEGMICAENELGLGDSHEGIMVLDAETPAGTEACEYFNVETDTVFEIGLTPNRIDGASHYGTARDLAAYLNQFETIKASLPSVEEFKIDNNDLEIPVIVETEKACPRYTGLTISGIKVGTSPVWLQNRLKSIGLVPINNIVDITNYVLHETGQPLHAFDAAKISGGKVVVKTLPENTKFITLDENEKKLTGEDLMICDSEKGMCIAGIFGGIQSGVTTDTNSIFLESAYFDPVYIRKTSKHHLLNTDASFRFERGADPEMTIYALKRAALLIKEIAGGKISSQIQDEYPNPFKPDVVKLSFAHLNRLIGMKIPVENVKRILLSLDMEIIEDSKEFLMVKVPLYRVDVTREADVIEEVLRIFGYNQVEINPKSVGSLNHFDKPDKEKITDNISTLLTSNGFYEIMANSLTKSEYYDKSNAFNGKESVGLSNPLSQDLNTMRQSLIFGGLETILYNINRKRSNLKLFEFGSCYWLSEKGNSNSILGNYCEEERLAIFITGNKNEESWQVKSSESDWYFLKGVVHLVLNRIGVKDDDISVSDELGPLFNSGLMYTLNKKELVRFGIVSSDILQSFDISQNVLYAEFKYSTLLEVVKNATIRFQPVAKYPEVKRDLALLLDKSIQFNQIRDLAYKTEKKLLKNVHVFDVYTDPKIGENKKSYAVNFTLQDSNKTLTDKQIDKVMRNLMNVFKNNLDAVIR